MKIDTETRRQIITEVRDIMAEVMEESEERWLSGQQLTKQFACFTPSWLKTYGCTLPRTQAVVIDRNGSEHRTGWVYPLHKIQRLMKEGGIKKLSVRTAEA